MISVSKRLRGRTTDQTSDALVRIRTTRYGLTPVVVMLLFFFTAGITSDVANVALPNVAQDLNFNLAFIGGLFAMVGVIGTLAQLAVGWWADRIKRVLLYGFSLIETGAAVVLMGLAGTAGIFGAGQVAQRLGSDFANAPQNSLLADYYPLEARGRIYGMTQGVQNVTAVIALFIAGVTVTIFGWRSNFIVLGIAAMLLGLVSLGLLREPIRGFFERRAIGMDEKSAELAEPPQSFGEGWRSFWSVRTLRQLWFAAMLSQVFSVGFSVYLPFVWSQEYGLDTLQRSWVSAPGLVLGLLGAYGGGRLVDRIAKGSPGTVLRVVTLISSVTLVTVTVVALRLPLWLTVVAVSVQFGILASTQPAIFSLTSQVIPPSVRSQGMQVLFLAGIPAEICLGVLFGPLVQNYGFAPMLFAMLPFLALYLVVLYSTSDYFEVDRRNALVAAAAAAEARNAAHGKRLLVCRKVNVEYDSNQVLFGVDLTIEEGEIVALLGTNGAGKSTLLRAISGSQEASDGAIVFDGREITHMPPHEIARRGIVLMPGGRGLFPGLTVEDNLRLGTWMAEPGDVEPRLREAYELFPVLWQRRQQTAGMLSGGEQQMLSLAQAFMSHPRLLLIDELSLGLSPALVGELLEKVKAIHAKGATVVIVEQSVNVALGIARRAVFMEKGEVRFAGSTAELLSRPDILRAVYVKGTSGAGAVSARLHASAHAANGVAAAQMPLLEARNVTKRFGGVTALDDVSLALQEGQILGLIGPNGSGKTTLFDIMSGYQTPDSGHVFFQGQDITALPAHDRAHLHLLRRFQDARLFPSLTVEENLLMALDQRLESRNVFGEALQLPRFRQAERKARRRADQLIDLLGIEAHRDKRVKELSTGLRRIVDMAVTLASAPRVLMLDEPSSGIAQLEAEGLAQLLLRVQRETGCSMLIVEHDMNLISRIADELVALVNGTILVRGTSNDVLNDERLVEAYLGGSEAAVRRSGSLV